MVDRTGPEQPTDSDFASRQSRPAHADGSVEAGRRPPEVACLLSAEKIAQRVRQLAEQISRDYAGKRPLVVGILKGAWVFMADLVRHLTIPVRCDFVMLSSYGHETVSSGRVELLHDLTLPARDQHVLLIEDLLDTGFSTQWLVEHLSRQRPASLRLCVLLDKPERREAHVKADYVGFTIPNCFVVGYGIDYAHQYRELPFVGYISDDPRE